MTFAPRKARRSKSKLRLAICGPSGSGKTLSALMIAYGITKDWSKIGLIDTESGSGEEYVGENRYGDVVIGEYEYWRIEPPFTIAKQVAAMKGFEALGMEVVINDSLSHVWAGSGGLLDKKDKIPGNSFAAWAKVTPEHESLIEAIKQMKCHSIYTMRSKQKYVLSKDEKGKETPQKVGMEPIQREGMEYEFTVVLDMDMEHIASSNKDRTGVIGGKYVVPTPKIGEALLEWLNRGVDAVHPWDAALKAIEDAADISELKKTYDNAVAYAKELGDVPKRDAAVAAKDKAKARIGKAAKAEAPAKATDKAVAEIKEAKTKKADPLGGVAIHDLPEPGTAQ